MDRKRTFNICEGQNSVIQKSADEQMYLRKLHKIGEGNSKTIRQNSAWC